ncbi:hypothetical protein, partial [Halalkalibacter lacteus]|uniref:hypothetical protein n=1 Tax=Halalkalibacter lacteus TaxID=3090663 RepID=UPI002FC75913
PVAAGIGVPAGATSVGEDVAAGSTFVVGVMSFHPGVGVSMIVAGNAAAFDVGASVHEGAGAGATGSLFAIVTVRGFVRGGMQPTLA